jgi:predicted acylesterase/phospholipase RssA
MGELGELFKRLIYSGGGAKGTACLGAYLALERLGLLAQLEMVSGASVGSIMAAFTAVGMPAVKLRELLLDLNFKALLGEQILFKKDGKPLENLIRTALIETVQSFLQEKVKKDQALQQDSDFNELVSKFLKTEVKSFSFRDLEKLRKLFPETFKSFSTLAVDADDINGAIQLFNAKDTPDVDIALACRASASIPIILQAVGIEINGEIRKFIDGGLVNNFPDYFEGKKDGNQKKEETFVIGFSEGSDTENNALHQAVHGSIFQKNTLNGTPVERKDFYYPSILEKFKRNTLLKLFGYRFPYKNTAQKNAGYKNISEKYSTRTIGLGVNITTTDFATAQKHACDLASLGYLDTMTYCINYNLADRDLDNFYVDIMRDFRDIYRSLRKDDNWQKTTSLGRALTLLNEVLDKQGIKDEKVINRESYYLVREWVGSKSDLRSRVTCALSCAGDLHSGVLKRRVLRSESVNESSTHESANESANHSAVKPSFR